MSSQEHLLSMDGVTVGWNVLPKTDTRLSEDVAYALHDIESGNVFFGVFDGMGGHNDGHAAAQAAWHDIVRQAGGWAGFATSDEDVKRILRVIP